MSRLILGLAVCAAANVSRSALPSLVDQGPIVLRDENVLGPVPNDLAATCGRDKYTGGLNSRRCRERTTH